MHPPCTPGANIWNAKAHLKDEISEVLPYLNAKLEGADYDRNSKVLTWEENDKQYAFRSFEISAAPARDREEANALINDLVALVNRIWQNRDEIEPDFKPRKFPSLMAIYKLLPGSNCNKCGYPTCMAYAADLRVGEAELSDCTELSPGNEDKLLSLFDEPE